MSICILGFAFYLFCSLFSLGEAEAPKPGYSSWDLMVYTQFHFIVSYLGNDQSFNVPERANLGIISYVPFINRVHFDVLFIA